MIESWVSLAMMLLGSSGNSAGMFNLAYAQEALQVKGKELLLNGRGIREVTLFKIKVFEASLYLEKNTKSPDEILTSPQMKLVRLKFLRNISKERYRRGSLEQFEKNCDDEDQTCQILKNRVLQASAILEDIKEGETVDYLFLGDRVEISQMGKKKGEVFGADYVRYCLNSWVGPSAQSEDLKAHLLGE